MDPPRVCLIDLTNYSSGETPGGRLPSIYETLDEIGAPLDAATPQLQKPHSLGGAS
ncbi:MAG: hypothetical protein ACPL3C_00460 [Pyrobaculum sp.]|uniref:hypothetical protein n=1 Tax=Pyrobaculum sp. TaxID=2004705 RepID=UPI003C961B3B